MHRRAHIILSLLLILILFVFTSSIEFNTYANELDPQIIYFHSSTCSACQTIRDENILKPLYDSNILIIEYDIVTDSQASRLFTRYNQTYDVPRDRQVVPILFVGNQYFTGLNEIENGVNSGTIDYIATTMQLLELNDDTISFSLTNFILLGLAGILSPCLIAVVLLFISLLSMTTNKRVLTKMSIIFIGTLFIMNLLIGTVLYQTFIYLSGLSSLFNTIINWVVISLASFMLVLNLYDYIQTLKKRYEKLKGNMPSKLQKMNKGLIEKLADRLEKGSSMVYLGTFLVGVIISFTRFFSNPANVAQIIELMYVTNEFFRGLVLLLIYNIVFILPLTALGIYRYQESISHRYVSLF
jgi:cytochrome c biogenesis protein CcdA